MSKLTLTDSQKAAVKSTVDFISSGHPKEWFCLEGKAGVGKTTVLIEIIMKYNGKKNIVACALAHKAKNVIFDKVKGRLHRDANKNSVSFYSIAGLLGMKMDEMSGEFSIDYYADKPIDTADIIIVDECSMVDEPMLELIMTHKKPMCKVIFSGDMGQLPPIRENGNDLESSVFNTKNSYKLYERLRQGDESPILPYSDYYWNSVMDNTDHVCTAQRDSVFGDKGVLHFGNFNDVMQQAIKGFKKCIDSGDTNMLKIVCYRNNTITTLNKIIRQGLYGDNHAQFEVGDVIMMYDNFSVSQSETVENSLEFRVLDVETVSKNIYGVDIETHMLTVDYCFKNGNNVCLPVVADRSIGDFNALVARLFDNAKMYRLNSAERKNAYKNAYNVKNMFANVKHSFCISSHKSQGSTYKSVIVYESDIMGVYATSMKTKYRSMYTAITRGSNMCVIMNDNAPASSWNI
jgi:hypothetical protein